MPAAAVIPAPIAYIKVAAVKKLVVERRCFFGDAFFCSLCWHLVAGTRTQEVYFEKIRVFKAGASLNTLAWNNRIGPCLYFVGFRNGVMINRDSWGH